MSIGVMMAGGKIASAQPSTVRQKDDWYPTQAEITYACIEEEKKFLPPGCLLWENACGDGAMARVLEWARYKVVGTDLVYRGYGRGGVNFLKTKKLISPRIFTNPPYLDDLPEKFLRHSIALGATYICMLLKSNFFHTQGRVALWDEFEPAREYKVAWRPDFLGLGGGTMDVTFWVWDARYIGQRCQTFLLRKPRILPGGLGVA